MQRQSASQEVQKADSVRAEAECSPVIVHYYLGKFGTKQTFGHVAIQLGKYYLSYGSSDQDRTEASANAYDDIKTETDFYGNHVCILLPDALLKGHIPKEIAEWEERWSPLKYDIFAHNCAHAVLDCVIRLGLLSNLNAKELNSKKEIIEKGKTLRPVEVASLLSEVSLNFVAQQAKKLKEIIKKPTEKDSENAISSVVEIITLNISRLLNEIVKESERAASIDINKKQKKAIALIKLQEKIPFLNVDELTQKLMEVSKALGGRTGESLFDCYFLLNGLNNQQKLISDLNYKQIYTKEFASKSSIAECYEKYEEMKIFFSTVPVTSSALQDLLSVKIEEYHLKHLNIARELKSNDFNDFKELRLLIETFKNECKFFKSSSLSSAPAEISADLKKLLERLNKTNNVVTANTDLMAICNKFKVRAASISEQKSSSRRNTTKSVVVKEAVISSQKPIKLVHINWLKYHLENIQYWYIKHGSTTNLFNINQLILNVYNISLLVNQSPGEEFDLIIKLVKEKLETWRIAHKLESMQQIVDYLNKENGHSLVRDLMQLYISSCLIRSGKCDAKGLILDYEFSGLKDLKLDDKQAFEQFMRLRRRVDSLPDGMLKKDLLDKISQLVNFTQDKAISFLQALKELAIEINRVKIFAEKESNKEKISVDILGRALNEIGSAVVVEKPKDEVLSAEVLLFIKSAINNSNNTKTWNSQTLIGGLPRVVDSIRLLLVHNNKSSSNILALCKGALAEKDQTSRLSSFFNKEERWIQYFYAGIIALANGSKLPADINDKNALESIKDIGKAYLPVYRTELSKSAQLQKLSPEL